MLGAGVGLRLGIDACFLYNMGDSPSESNGQTVAIGAEWRKIGRNCSAAASFHRALPSMTLHALYHPERLAGSTTLVLSADEARHARALRLREGAQVLLLDGQGGCATARIVRFDRRGMEVAVEAVRFDAREREAYIAMAIGVLADKTRFEWCLEKLVELGASAVFPLVTERTEGRFSRARLERIMIAALKQSQRRWLPELSEPIAYEAFLQQQRADCLGVLCHESADESAGLLDLLGGSPPSAATIVIGPEGGFSDREVELAVRSGASVAWLGAARLRAETAAVAAMSIAAAAMRGGQRLDSTSDQT